MRSGSLIAILGALLVCAPIAGSAGADRTQPRTTPVKVIFDTDMDSDCDDAAALAVLHALADRGEAEILATVVSSKNEWSAPCVDAINTYYGRPDLPIGVPRGAGANDPSKYARQIAEQFPQDLGSGKRAPHAAQLYRRILAQRPDQSIVIVTVGDLTNIAELLKLPAEGGSPSGRELAGKKVRMWVCMGGNFVGRPARDDLKLGNNNFTRDKAGTFYAIKNWPAPLTFVGREIGSVPSGLKVGARLRELPESNPVRMAYQYFFDGPAQDRHVADPTTVLYAVRGLRDYWDIESRGYMDLQPDMTFQWRYDQDRQHAYLLKRTTEGQPNDRYIEGVIEELLVQPPRRPPPKDEGVRG
jgi:inosine-uridine preferring nucleoside hydrolase